MSTQPVTVFVSSRMQEFAAERKALYDLLPTLQINHTRIVPWVFEYSAYASNKTTREVYLSELNTCDLYIGLFGSGYGQWTIDEFEQATRLGMDRHIYIKSNPAAPRDPRLQAFLDAQSDVETGVTARWFTTAEELCSAAQKSLEKWIAEYQLWRPGLPQARLITDTAGLHERPQKLIGRDTLLAEIEQHLRSAARPVLLQGFGGAGKTAIAAEVAARMVDKGETPLLWLRTGSDDPQQVFAALAAPFGQQESMSLADESERPALLNKLLVERQVKLLVLDDVWNGKSLKQVIDSLPTGLPLLVTSRQRYPLMQRVDISRLARADALKLLAHYAGQPLEADPAAAELCERVGDLAFALRIAGATLEMDDTLTPRDLLRRIADEPFRMQLPGDFSDKDGENVAALLEVSLRGLGRAGQDARQAFQAFGALFAPAVSLELLAAVMNSAKSPAQVETALSTLYRNGLIETIVRAPDGDPLRTVYRLHDLAYSYSRAILPKADEKRLHAMRVCRDYARQHSAQMPLLDLEINNLLGAAGAANTAKQPDLLVDIMRVLATGDDFYFAAHGHSGRSLALLQDAAQTSGDLQTAFHFYNELGYTYNNLIVNYAAALAAYQHALTLATQMGSANLEARTLSQLGVVCFHQGEADAASYLDRAEALAREKNDLDALSLVLQHRSYHAMYSQPPDHAAGWRYADEAARIAKREGFWDTYFHAMQNRGGCENELGRYAEALATHQEIYALAQADPPNLIRMAEALWSIGEDFTALGQRQQAQEALNKSLKLWRETGSTGPAAELEAYMQEHKYSLLE